MALVLIILNSLQLCIYRSWLQSKENRARISMDTSELVARLDQLSNKPIGTLGSSTLQINRRFIISVSKAFVVYDFNSVINS